MSKTVRRKSYLIIFLVMVTIFKLIYIEGHIKKVSISKFKYIINLTKYF